MKKFVCLLGMAILLCLSIGLAGCFGGGGSNNSGETKAITISIAENGLVGEKVLLEKQANFSPFYQKISYTSL